MTGYAAILARMSNCANSNIGLASRRAVGELLAELKRFYGPYLDPEQFSASGGRPYGYSISGAVSRLHSLVQAAQGFISDDELSSWRRQFQDDLDEATQLGGGLVDQLQQLVAEATTTSSGAANWAAVLSAADLATAYIEGVSMDFRDAVAQIVIYAIALGHGFTKIQKEIEAVLIQHAHPGVLESKREIKQRAELIARSELANAYVEAQRRTARSQGFSYVRWIAAKDERTCPLCVARHGQIYRVEKIVIPCHSECRCSLSPVMDEAVKEKNLQLRADLLDADYWRASRDEAIRELRAVMSCDESRTRAELAAALLQPTPYEKFRNPGAAKAVMPAVRL